jgi:addiction module RelE/StbE family toxin
MSQVVWLKRAIRSLDSILTYIAHDDRRAAQSLGTDIRARVEILRTEPNLGRAGRVIGTRELVVHQNYIVVYRVRNERVEILTVQHTRRRWPDTL